MHGEPSWCFLYRKMIPVLTAAGCGAIAPDLVGFGRSDKPTERDDYTYARHVEWMRAALFDALDLRDVTLVCQDWGGLIGLRLVGEHPDRFARVVAANTFLPTGDTPPGEAFLGWQQFSQTVADFDVGVIVSGGCAHRACPTTSSPRTTRRSPTTRYKAGARQFPMLVPTSPDDPASAPNQGGVGGAARRGRSRSSPRSPTRTRSPAAATARSSATCRARGPAAHDDRGRRALPAGGQGRGAGQRHRELARRHVTLGHDYGIRVGVFFFGGVEIDDAGAGPRRR